MASIHKLDKSRYWYAFYRDASGTQKGVSLKIPISPDGPDAKIRAALAAENKRKAQSLADQMEAAARGDQTEAQIRKMLTRWTAERHEDQTRTFTTKAMLEKWLDTVSVQTRGRTYERYQKIVASFLVFLGQKATAPATTITHEQIENWINTMLRAGFAPTTARIHLKGLSAFFAVCLKRGQVAVNPCAGVTVKNAVSETRDPFTPQEVRLLLETAPSTDWHTCILIAATTGLRLVDVTELQWQSVDLFGGVIRTRPRKTAGKKRDLLIPLHPALKDHLLTLPAPSSPDAPVMPSLQGKAVGGRSGLSLTFRGIMNAAGVEGVKQAGKGQGRAFNSKGFHSLRHFFVTEMARAGVACELRMKLSGHSTAAAHNTYTHEAFSQLQNAVAAVKF